MAKREPRGHALTIKGSADNQVTNPLLRIASSARADMQRIGSQFGLTPMDACAFPESSRRSLRRSSMDCLDSAATA